MTWTQAICAARWNQDFAGTDKTRAPKDYLMDVATDETGPNNIELCCYCNKPTRCGIYVRIDPSTVPYPRQEL